MIGTAQLYRYLVLLRALPRQGVSAVATATNAASLALDDAGNRAENDAPNHDTGVVSPKPRRLT